MFKQGDLAEALDGLEAASRLSEQLDKKEEALRALKEEGKRAQLLNIPAIGTRTVTFKFTFFILVKNCTFLKN